VSIRNQTLAWNPPSVWYLSSMSSVAEITEAIDHLDAREQVRLLNELPNHLKIKPEDIAWLRASEPSFEFWDNPEDAIYDQL
jgi:hypothetical protein